MSDNVTQLLETADRLKESLTHYRQMQSDKVTKAFEIEYTYESNKIEGNTLTLQETALIIEKGLTIGGKSLNEHLEAINHTHALDYVKEIVRDKIPFSETILCNIHKLILQGIDNKNAGTYRTVQVLISGARHIPTQPYLIAKAMEDYFRWYNAHKDSLHPVILAAELHERLVTIHPFTDGNGRTSRLIMNLVLLQHGYPIAILKGDAASRLEYYRTLDAAQTHNNKQDFITLIIVTVTNTLNRILKAVK